MDVLIEYEDTLRVLETMARTVLVCPQSDARFAAEGVQLDLENFANACRAEIQHRQREFNKATHEFGDLL